MRRTYGAADTILTAVENETIKAAETIGNATRATIHAATDECIRTGIPWCLR